MVIEIPEKIEVQEVDLHRRNSTGSSDFRISEEKAVPSYLKSSTGSCHDICKFGTRRHNLHKTGSWPIPTTLKHDNYANKSSQKEKTKTKPVWTHALNHPPIRTTTSLKSSNITKRNAVKDTKNSKKTKKKCIPKRDSPVEVKNEKPESIIPIIESSSNQNEEMDTEVEENRSRVLRSGSISPEESDANSRKLKFGTRKVLDVNGDENVESKRKSLLRRQASDGQLFQSNDYGDYPIRVVLRHQDVEPKNNAPELLNNMIEETVSKLVQGRTSKVKALVGAFESVINFQVSSTRFRTL